MNSWDRTRRIPADPPIRTSTTISDLRSRSHGARTSWVQARPRSAAVIRSPIRRVRQIQAVAVFSYSTALSGAPGRTFVANANTTGTYLDMATSLGQLPIAPSVAPLQPQSTAGPYQVRIRTSIRIHQNPYVQNMTLSDERYIGRHQTCVTLERFHERTTQRRISTSTTSARMASSQRLMPSVRQIARPARCRGHVDRCRLGRGKTRHLEKSPRCWSGTASNACLFCTGEN